MAALSLIHENAWLGNLLVALVAVGTTLLAFGGLIVIVRRLTGRYPVSTAFLERARRPARLVLVLAALQFVWEAAPSQLPLMSGVRHATALCLIAALTWLGTRLIRAAIAIVALLNPSDIKDNLRARSLQTQVNVLGRTVMVFIMLIGLSCALMTFPGVRQIGTSLLASAGVAGLVVGLAARPVLSNLIAGIQIALTQPIRLDDVLIITGEWGRVEQITSAFVVLRIWDERRLVIPLQWFVENPFQNWTRTSSSIIGTVFWWVDYRMPLAALRAEITRLCQQSPDWDGRLAMLQVVDTTEKTMKLRALVTSIDSSHNWDLRCQVREGIIALIARDHPDCLPRLRAQLDATSGPDAQVPEASASSSAQRA